MAENLKIETTISVNDDTKSGADSAVKNIEETTKALDDSAASAEKAGVSFSSFTMSALGVAGSLISVSINLAKLAANYLGLTVEIETTNKKLKVFDFFVQNTRKEVTISLSFLKKFSDFIRGLSFPLKPLADFIDLLGDFRVKIGIGQGEKTLFDHTADGVKKAASAVKDFQLDDFKSEIKSAITSLMLFSVQAATTFSSVKKGIEREADFSAASRTISGTREELDALKVVIDDLSATDLAVDTSQLYQVAGIAGAMGKSIEEIPGFLKLVSEAAIAFNIPADDVAEKLATIQTQLKLTDEGVVSLADQVNALADSMPGKVNELDIFTVLSTGVATAGKSFGLLKGETIALVGSLLALGEAPETARTGIVSLLTKLQTASVQTDSFKNALSQMGTSADKLKEDIRTKPMPTLIAFLKQLKGFDEFKKKELLTGIMGTGGDMLAVSKLTESVDLLEESLSTATDVTKYSGSVHKAYQMQIATTSAKIDLLKNSLDNFIERLTSTFLPAVNLVVDGITRMVTALSTFSQEHPFFKTIAAVAVSVLSLAGIFRLFSFLWARLLPIISSNLAKVGLSLASFTLSLTGLGAVIAAFSPGLVLLARNILLAAKAGEALKVFQLLLGFLFGGTVGVAIGSLALLFLGIANLLPMTIKWGETTATVSKVIYAAFSVISEGFNNAVKSITHFLVAIAQLKPVIGVFVGVAILAITNLVAALGGLTAIMASLAPVFAGVLAVLSSPITALVLLIAGIGVATQIAIYKATGHLGTFEEALESLLTGVTSMVNNVIRGFEFLASGIQHFTTLAGLYWDNFTGKISNGELKKAINEELSNFQGYLDELSKKDYIANFKTDVEQQLKENASLDSPDEKAGDNKNSEPDKSQESVDAAKKQADLISQIKKEQRDRDLQALKDDEAEKIRLIENSGKTQKQIENEVFAAKIASAKAIAQFLKNQMTAEQIDMRGHAAEKIKYSQEELQAKKATLKEIETAYKANLDSLRTLEKQHRDNVVALDKEIRDLKKQGQDGEREIARAGMTDTQIAADKELEIEQKTAQVKELISQGEYEQAAALGKELNALTLEQAKTKAAAAKEGGDPRDVTIAQYEYQQSLGLTNEALTLQKKAEQEKADAAAFEAERTRQAYENVGKQIEALNTTLTEGGDLNIIVDTTQVDVLKQKLDDLPKDLVIDVTFNEKGERSFSAAKTGGNVPSLDSGGGVYEDGLAMIHKNEFMLNPTGVKIASSIVGASALAGMNKGNMPKLSGGGQASGRQNDYLKLDLNTPVGNLPAKVDDTPVLRRVVDELRKQSRVS